jgi:sec-independent protein translocase protein TatB
MFDIAWSHLAVIAVVALIVIGPKDLPRVLRTVGMWVGKARAVAREFQGSLDQMIREAELDEIRKQVEETARFDLEREVEKNIDPAGELRRSIEEPSFPTSEARPIETKLEETTPLPVESQPVPPASAPPPAAKSDARD